MGLCSSKQAILNSVKRNEEAEAVYQTVMDMQPKTRLRNRRNAIIPGSALVPNIAHIVAHSTIMVDNTDGSDGSDGDGVNVDSVNVDSVNVDSVNIDSVNVDSVDVEEPDVDVGVVVRDLEKEQTQMIRLAMAAILCLLLIKIGHPVIGSVIFLMAMHVISIV